MSSSHADGHDLDKLGRWYRGWTDEPSESFPAHAMFLVTSEDRFAHDIFRQFRSSFEARGAGFHHLVIFGQHGLSSTVLRFLDNFKLTQEALPLLGLFSGPAATTVHFLQLKEVDASMSAGDEHWQEILTRLEIAADSGESVVDFPKTLPATQAHHLKQESALDLVERILKGLS